MTAHDVDPILVQISHAAARDGFAVIAYCFMPDHLHLLVEGVRADSSMRVFMKHVKQRTSFAWTQTHGGELWQRSYFDHVLRSEDDTATVARYVLGNPVRAGLVDVAAAYPFSGSMTMDVGDLLTSS